VLAYGELGWNSADSKLYIGTFSPGTIQVGGWEIGTDVQAYDAGLLSIAAATTAADNFLYTTALDVYAVGTITTFGRSLVDDADAATARTTLGLVIGTNVAAVASPTFTGTAAAVTGTVDTSSTQIATQAFVLGQAGAATPLINGTAAVGTSTRYSRQDHVHASDTTRAPLASPTFTGIVTTAGQIAFPSTANLSGNVNTLDDYERGNWTPTFIASTTDPTVTYDAITYGIYLKIGLMVFISGSVVLTAASGGSGNLQIGGLPFVARNGTTGGYGSLALGFRSGWTTTTPGTAYVQANASYIQLYTTLVTATITTANLSATSYIQFSGFYRTTL